MRFTRTRAQRTVVAKTIGQILVKHGQKTVKKRSNRPFLCMFNSLHIPLLPRKATDYHCFGAHARMINTVASTRDTNLFAQRLEPNSRYFRTGFSSMRPSQTQLSTALQTASMDGAGFSYSYPIHILNCQQLLSCTLILVRHHRILQMSRLSAEAF
jgi:hypothetical protein